MAVAKAQATNTKQLSAMNIDMLFSIYLYWTQHNLLPKDPLADNKVTLLDNLDAWLAASDGAWSDT